MNFTLAAFFFLASFSANAAEPVIALVRNSRVELSTYGADRRERYQATRPSLTPLFRKTARGWTPAQPQDAVGATWWPLVTTNSPTPLYLFTEGRETLLKQRENAHLLTKLRKQNQDSLEILALNRRAPKDRKQWRKAKPSAKTQATAKKKFRARFPFQAVCTREAEGSVWRGVVLTNKPLADRQLKIERLAYAAKDGTSLVGVKVDGPACRTDPYVIHDYFQTHWFMIRRGQAEELRLKADRRLMPLLAADFDGDGKTEWVFRSNAGGGEGNGSAFILVDESFRELSRATTFIEPLPTEKN